MVIPNEVPANDICVVSDTVSAMRLSEATSRLRSLPHVLGIDVGKAVDGKHVVTVFYAVMNIAEQQAMISANIGTMIAQANELIVTA